MSLEQLPAELLDQVLSYHESSHFMLDLYKTGSRIIIQKLTSGLTHLRLNRSDSCFTIVPPIVLESRSLRSINLTTSSSSFISPGLRHSIVKQLPATLESIRFKGRDFIDVFLNVGPEWTPSNGLYTMTQFKRGASPLMDLGSMFPRLHTLEFVSPGSFAWYAALPETITRLIAPHINFHVPKDRLSSLPPSIVRLETTFWVHSNETVLQDSLSDQWASCLPHLDHIDCLVWSPGLAIPKTMRGGKIQTNKIEPQLAESLLPATESLYCNQFSTEHLQRLPIHLKSLTVKQFDQRSLTPHEIGLLPRSLTNIDMPFSIQARAIMFWLEVEGHIMKEGSFWPSSLTSLQHIRLADADLCHLPSTLTSLGVTAYARKGKISGSLPRFLKSLTIDSDVDERLHWETPLPTTLTELSLDLELANSADISLPNHLTRFKTTIWPVHLLAALPKTITSITFSALLGAKTVTIEERNEAIKQLPAGLQSLEAADCLIRTPSDFFCAEDAFAHLTQLRTLIFGGKLPSATLRHLPKLLRVLELEKIESIDDADAPFLSPRLVTLKLTRRELLSQALINHWPAGATGSIARDDPALSEVNKRIWSAQGKLLISL